MAPRYPPRWPKTRPSWPKLSPTCPQDGPSWRSWGLDVSAWTSSKVTPAGGTGYTRKWRRSSGAVKWSLFWVQIVARTVRATIWTQKRLHFPAPKVGRQNPRILKASSSSFFLQATTPPNLHCKRSLCWWILNRKTIENKDFEDLNLDGTFSIETLIEKQ